jgi:hypothetical protein
MRRIAIIGAVLATALATGAVGASVAAAVKPEFVVSGSFPDAFTTTSKAAVVETIGGLRGTCKADTGSGEVTGPKSLLVKFTWTGCKQARSNCQNTNTAGVIVTETLSGTLGYVSTKPKVVGIDLTPPTGGPGVSFTCGEDETVEIFGSLIGKIPFAKQPIELKFAQKEGHQHITHLLGGPTDVPMTSLLGGALQESGINFTDVLTFATPAAIVA